MEAQLDKLFWVQEFVTELTHKNAKVPVLNILDAIEKSQPRIHATLLRKIESLIGDETEKLSESDIKTIQKEVLSHYRIKAEIQRYGWKYHSQDNDDKIYSYMTERQFRARDDELLVNELTKFAKDNIRLLPLDGLDFTTIVQRDHRVLLDDTEHTKDYSILISRGFAKQFTDNTRDWWW